MMNEIENAFNEESDYDVIFALAYLVDESLSFNELTHGQKVVCLIIMFDSEVANGGFHQLFTNSSGDYLFQILEVVQVIGAVKVWSLLKEAISLFPNNEIPDSMEGRDQWLNSLGEEAQMVLSKLDNDYYTWSEDIFKLGVNYLKNYKLDFLNAVM